MDNKLFKKSVKWFFILVLAHIAGMIIFSIALSSSVASISDDYKLKANIIIFIFDIIFDICFSVLYFKIENSYVDYQRRLKELLRKHDFSIVRVFKQEFFKEHMVQLAIYAVLQIPFVIFFVIWGMSLTTPLIFEQFYVVDAGSYLVTNSAILGFLVNTFLFATVFSAARVIFIAILKKDTGR